MAIRIVSSRYKDIISKSTLISKPQTSPAVYQLKPKEEKFGTLTKKTVGEKNLNKTNRTILLVGETGTGKSTLINALVNYTMGVKYEENIWFEIVEDEKRSQSESQTSDEKRSQSVSQTSDEKRSQSESQTSDVIVYEIFGYEGKTLPYSLTIIDTPGFRGDTRGIEHDVIISQRLFDLFRSDDGVHELSAVGLVLKASENRVNDRIKYILDSVMSLFGKNIEKNIVPLMTHSDGITPKNALKALEAANIKCARNEKNQPVHFLFNNNQNEQRTEETKPLLENAWTITERGMKQFTNFLEKSTSKKLNTTVEVLKARIRLTACIQNLQERSEKEKREGENLQTEMKELAAEKIKWLDEVYQHVEHLEQIALNVNSLSTHVHLDFLIEKMKERRDTEKVKKLEEIKSRRDEGTRGGLGYMMGKVATAGKAIKGAVKRGHHQIAE